MQMIDYPQEKSVTFNVITRGVPENTSVFISGSHEQLGNWNAHDVPMDKIDDSTWSKTFKFNAGTYLEFKFTLGSWQTEALGDNGFPLNNYSFYIDQDTILNYYITRWKNNPAEVKSGITGTIEFHRNMKGKGILSRDIAVWLPPDYETDTSKRFPVLYMHDGQNIFDPASSAFGMDWKMDETADSLIRQGKMSSIIIVGIYNTRYRDAEYSYTDSGYAYMKFIVEELKPFIDKTYRTLKGRKNTAVMGSSMGGLISLMLVWEYSDVFSKAACLSPAFKIKSLNYLQFMEKYLSPMKDIKIYIDNGGIGLEKELQPGIEETIRFLENKISKNNISVYFDENAEHDENAWAQRVWRPLLFLFGN